jgi:hypothetical protein
VKSGLILAILLLGFGTIASAQPAPEPPADADNPVAAPTGNAPLNSFLRGILELRHFPTANSIWLPGREIQPDSRRPRWSTGNPLEIISNGFAVRRNPNQPKGGRRINRTFVPIPLLRWECASPIGPHAFIAFNPSIVIGRRPTFAPDVFRGGRTFGVALQMRVRFDQAGVPAATAGPPAPTPGILSRVRAVFDNSRQ